MTGSYSWHAAGPKERRREAAILGGWQIAGISTYVSGAPLPTRRRDTNFACRAPSPMGVDSATPATSPARRNRAAQPVLTCDPRQDVPSGYSSTPRCFAAPLPGENGNYIFPYIKGQAYSNHDLSLFKNFRLGSKGQKLQLRIAAYNVLNHPIAFPDRDTNLTLRFTNGVLSEPELRQAAATTTSSDGASSSSRCGTRSNARAGAATRAPHPLFLAGP